MKLGIRTKLFVVSLIVIALAVVVAYAYARTQVEGALMASMRDDLHVRAQLAALEAEKLGAGPDDMAAWDALATSLGKRAEARVTLIREDGKVLGESELAQKAVEAVSNHADRPEVRGALAGGRGEHQRLSATLGQRMLYVAVPFRNGEGVRGVARVALPLTQVDAALARLTNVLSLGTLIALALAVVMSSIAAELASRTARDLTASARRMAAGDLEVRTRPDGADEFGELGRALNQLAESLSSTVGELRTSHARLSGILDGMQEGVLLIGGDGRVELINPALREMLLIGSDAVGRTPLEVIRHAELKNVIEEARSEARVATTELELSGLRPRRLLVRAAPMGAREGGLFAVFVDVTDMRRLESLRKDFVANVSHELRTPVTAIRSAAETLDSVLQNDPASAARFVQIIERNASRLQALVEDLLDLSRIESRQYQMEKVPVALSAVCARISGLFRDRAESSGVELETALAPGVDRVLADPRALENVLSNLVDNAVKYAGRGASVRLKAVREADRVRVTVEDTGPGIERKHLPRLFERFYRVDRGRSRDLGGTGLGLAIVKHLVEAMGSQIVVESEVGRGTRFSFALREPSVQSSADTVAAVED